MARLMRSSLYCEEAPPAYDADDDAPSYCSILASETQQHRPPVVYSLRRVKRNEQAFVPLGPSLFLTQRQDGGRLENGPEGSPDFPEYCIKTKPFAGLTRNQPGYVLRRSMVPQPSERCSQASDTIYSSSNRRLTLLPDLEESNDIEPDLGSLEVGTRPRSETIAAIRFLRSGEFPWTPRAKITYHRSRVQPNTSNQPRSPDAGDASLEKVDCMQLMRDKHNRWTMQVQGSEHSWYMGRRPDVLLLVADSQRSLSSWGDPEPDILRRDVVAWFAYGKQGHWAGKSGEIGRLVVPRRTAEDQPSLEFLDQAISSLTAVVAHWRNEGRLLANPDFDLDDLGPKRFQLEGE